MTHLLSISIQITNSFFFFFLTWFSLCSKPSGYKGVNIKPTPIIWNFYFSSNFSRFFFTVKNKKIKKIWYYGFITAYAISAYHHKCGVFQPSAGEVYLIQHYVIKFVSDLWQVSGFLRVLRCPPTIKLAAMI